MLRVIGDVHSKVSDYLDIVDGCEYSLQIGDMGFNYKHLDYVDSTHHRIVFGNHDNFDIMPAYPHFLGGSGTASLDDIDFFFISGAFSVDKKARLRYEAMGYGKSWWEKEQLSTKELQDAIDLYCDVKPNLMISHTCPTMVSRLIGNPGVLRSFGFDPSTFRTNTGEALQRCFDYHKPKVHIFGHMHQSRVEVVGGTTFICLNELEYLDIKDNKIEHRGYKIEF